MPPVPSFALEQRICHKYGGSWVLWSPGSHWFCTFIVSQKSLLRSGYHLGSVESEGSISDIVSIMTNILFHPVPAFQS